MLKLAIIFLLIALFAGALGMGGLSNFAMGASKVFFSIWGLVIVACILIAFFGFRALSRR